MDAYLCERGIMLDVANFVEKFGNERLLKLRKHLTICTVDRITKIPKRTSMFSMVKIDKRQFIELPKFCLNMLKTKKIINDVAIDLAVGAPMSHEYIGRSNPNQCIVVNHIVSECADIKSCGFKGFTLKMMPGSGKTFVAMDLISKIKRKTLIVVPNSYLLNQWVNLLTQYFPTATIGELYGKRKCDGDIIVGIINTIADLDSFEITEKLPMPMVSKSAKFIKVKREINVDELFATIGLTIFDESQMYVSKEFRKAFKRVHSRITVGLSATPDIREDKLDRIHTAWLGPIVDAEALEGYSPAQDSFVSTATLIEYHGRDEHVQYSIREDGMLEYQSIVESIVNDPHRNTLLVQKIMELANHGKHVFVFSDRRSHLEQLYDIISEIPIDEPIEMDIPEADRKIVLYGGSTDETIQKATAASKIIFTTYQYSSTGVSIQKMDALVLCTPRRSNMKQIINRVFRQGSDQTSMRKIIDVVDMKMPIKRQHKERIKAYHERGSHIEYEQYHA